MIVLLISSVVPRPWTFFMQQARNAGFTIKNVLIWRKNNHTAGDLDAQYGQCYEPILYLSRQLSLF